MRSLPSTALRALLLGVLALLLPACGGGCCDDPGPGSGITGLPDDAMEGFLVLDVNDTSPRAQEFVSPRDYGGKVSAWYFGHAT